MSSSSKHIQLSHPSLAVTLLLELLHSIFTALVIQGKQFKVHAFIFHLITINANLLISKHFFSLSIFCIVVSEHFAPVRYSQNVSQSKWTAMRLTLLNSPIWKRKTYDLTHTWRKLSSTNFKLSMLNPMKRIYLVHCFLYIFPFVHH